MTEKPTPRVMKPGPRGHGWQWNAKVGAHTCVYCKTLWTPFDDRLFACEFIEKADEEHRRAVMERAK
jgi:hypothetical protein